MNMILSRSSGLIQSVWVTPQRRLRSIIAIAAGAAGAATLAFSLGIGVTFLVFGVFAALHLSFDIAVSDACESKKQEGQGADLAEHAQFVDTSQAAVIAAAATILGLITAFSGGALPGAAKVAVVGLGGGVLVLFVSRGSQARLAPAGTARTLGIYADVIGFSLFTLGIIGIIVSLLVTGGLGVQSNSSSDTSPASLHLVRP
jgi:hypothetical protein